MNYLYHSLLCGLNNTIYSMSRFNRSDGKVVSVTTGPTWIQVFSAVQGHYTVAFYDAITGPTWVHLYRQFGKNGWYALGMTTPP